MKRILVAIYIFRVHREFNMMTPSIVISIT